MILDHKLATLKSLLKSYRNAGRTGVAVPTNLVADELKKIAGMRNVGGKWFYDGFELLPRSKR